MKVVRGLGLLGGPLRGSDETSRGVHKGNVKERTEIDLRLGEGTQACKKEERSRRGRISSRTNSVIGRKGGEKDRVCVIGEATSRTKSSEAALRRPGKRTKSVLEGVGRCKNELAGAERQN